MYPLPAIIEDSNNFFFNAAPPSKFKVRLIPNIQGLNYSGRLEVNYDNKGWGTVCDNSFNLIDANAVCNMLNFKGAICAISNAQLGRGSGKNCLSVKHLIWESGPA